MPLAANSCWTQPSTYFTAHDVASLGAKTASELHASCRAIDGAGAGHVRQSTLSPNPPPEKSTGAAQELQRSVEPPRQLERTTASGSTASLETF